MWEYLDSPVENSQDWETKDSSGRSKPIATPPNRGGLIKLGETDDIATKLITLTKKVDDLLMKRQETTKVMEELQEIGDICKL